ncbi:hypothetical protein C1646_765482 [Rhizophagus diaphanus]|nr:hypothetical protein C1646_765482 [Rhizophagus diaphanus] [Rhizophagus sp. MUCL 43196]
MSSYSIQVLSAMYYFVDYNTMDLGELDKSQVSLFLFKQLEIKLVKVKGHSEVKGNEEADRVAKNNTKKPTCINVKDLQQKDLIYDITGMAKESVFSDTTNIIEEELSNKWTIVANNTVCKCNQIIKNFLLQEKHIQLSQEDTQQLLSWNNNFFANTIVELKTIVKLKRIALTIAALFLEVFVNEFYNIIWQPRCKAVAEWKHTKGIKK